MSRDLLRSFSATWVLTPIRMSCRINKNKNKHLVHWIFPGLFLRKN
jgi:hypothetical protein